MRHEFNDLPQAVRERLVKLTSKEGAQDPRVLAAEPEWNMGWFKYFMLVAALGVTGFCLNFLWHRARHGIAPRHDEEVFLALALATAVGVIAAAGIAFRFIWKPPPYREGKWVFPSGLVQLSGGWVDFMPIAELGRPTLVTVRRNGSYSHSRLELGRGFTFIYGSNAAAEAAVSKIMTAKARMGPLLAARDAAALTALDPFAECSLSGTWKAPTLAALEGPTAAVVPRAARYAQWFGGLFLGAMASGAAFAFFLLSHRGR